MKKGLLIYLGVIMLSIMVILASTGSYNIISSYGRVSLTLEKNYYLEHLSDYENFTIVKPVFSGNGLNSSVGYGISAGYHSPGDEVGVILNIYRSETYRYNLIFVVKLFRIEEGGYLILLGNRSIDGRVIDNPVGFIGRSYFVLPMDDGVRYLLVVEAREDDVVVDMIKSIIIVPIQTMDAEIYLNKKVYRPGDSLTYTIVNLGEDPIIFGPCYKIYRWNGETWVLDDKLTPKFYSLIAIMLYRGKQGSFTISLDNARPGLYKILVEVEGETTGIKKTLEAEFIVMG